MIKSKINPGSYPLELFRSRGYKARKHLKEAGWDERKLTVVDLSRSEKSLFEQKGVAALRRYLARKDQWLFPSLEIASPLPFSASTGLGSAGQSSAVVVVPGGKTFLRKSGTYFVREIHRRFGIRLPLINDADVADNVFQRQNVIIFGGSHENGLARELAYRGFCGVADATVPGPGGWLVLTLAGPVAVEKNVVQITGDAQQIKAAVDYALDHLVESDEGLRLKPLHRVVPGITMKKYLCSWKELLAEIQQEARRPELRAAKMSADPVRAAAIIARALDSGGIKFNYDNRLPIQATITAARYFLITGDRRALIFFRALLFHLVDYYLKTPGGTSYPSDIDFYFGLLVNYYGLLEHDPAFSREDRIILANLLLAVMRSVFDYYRTIWAPRLKKNDRCNHHTFKGRSLFLGARYFAGYGIADVRQWNDTADLLFQGDFWSRFKQKENAGLYESLVFEHAASYSAFRGKELSLFKSRALSLAARAQRIVTDNFFRPVDYGDASVRMDARLSDSLAVLEVSRSGDPELQWFARNSFAKSHAYLTSPIFALTGLRRGEEGRRPKCGCWEKIALDPKARKDFAPDYPARSTFDKIAFRTGWGPEDQYLLLSGFGNLTVTHSHNEVNGIIRLNHLGRHWLVSNGYGKPPSVTNAAKSYYGRVRGPEDHNMLVLKNDGKVIWELPVACALLRAETKGRFSYSTSALRGYGGVDWYRTLIVLAGEWLLVIDRIKHNGRKVAGHIEWNILGDLCSTAYGWRLAQKGVFMDVSSPSGWKTRIGETPSEDWRRVLGGKEYPYASYPPRKIVCELPSAPSSGVWVLATLFAATRSSTPAYRLVELNSGHYRVEGKNCSWDSKKINTLTSPMDRR